MGGMYAAARTSAAEYLLTYCCSVSSQELEFSITHACAIGTHAQTQSPYTHAARSVSKMHTV